MLKDKAVDAEINSDPQQYIEVGTCRCSLFQVPGSVMFGFHAGMEWRFAHEYCRCEEFEEAWKDS